MMLKKLRQYRNFVLALLLIIVFVILSIDSIQIYLDHRKAQNAADNAALVAALAKLRGNDYSFTTAALDRALSNGYNNDGITNTVQVHNPPIIGPYTGARDYIQVIITYDVRTLILPVQAESKISAVVYVPPPCLECPIAQSEIALTNGGGPAVPSTPDSSTGIEAEFTSIDQLLKQSIGASLAYNKPEAMNLEETVTIELLLNLSISPDELGKEISEAGAVTTGTIEVTPRMTAYLYTHDSSALIVQPLHENPEQLIGEASTTKWSWSVKAIEGGTHTLTLKIFQLVKYENEDYWREVEAYDSDIQVKVSFGQRVQSLDWKWVLPTIATALLIPYFWRWYDQRKNKPQQTEKSKQNKPGNENLGNIFISYRRSDSADIVGRIYDRLIDEFGRNPIFKDVDSIPFGIDFKEYLDKRVGECNVLLAVIGDRWVDANDATGKKRLEDSSDFVRIEIESALERGIPVIPLLVRGAQMLSEEHLPLSLKKLVYRNGIQIRSDPDFHNDMNRLITALEKYIR